MIYKVKSIDELPEFSDDEFLRQVWVEESQAFRGHLLVKSVIPHYRELYEEVLGAYSLLSSPSKLDNLQSLAEGYGHDVVIVGDVESILQEELSFREFSVKGFHPNPDSPSSNHGLYPFQVAGIQKALARPAILLNWDTGTGKTIAGITIAQGLFEQGRVDRVIVLCTKSKKRDWQDAFHEFTELSAEIINGSRSQRAEGYKTSKANVWVLNYERFRYHSPRVRERKQRRNRNYHPPGDWLELWEALEGQRIAFIYDEVQKLKNRKNLQHIGVARFVKYGEIVHQTALSATPVENSPVDYYNLFRILQPDIFGSVKDFERVFTRLKNGRRCDMYGRYFGFRNLKRMRYQTDYYVHRVKKSDPEIAKLFPEAFSIVQPIELSDEDRRLYDEVIGKVRSEFDSSSYAENLSRLHVLRQICNSPELLKVSNSRLAQHFVESSPSLINSVNSRKLEEFMDLVDEIVTQGSKVVVFSQWTRTLNLLAGKLSDAKISYRKFHGGQDESTNQANYKAFKTDPSISVILCSDAGGEGLNFQESQYCIHYDCPWKFSTFKQRSDRISRITSKFGFVTVYYFLTEETVEEYVWGIVQRKKRMAEEIELVQDGDIQTLDKISTSDLRKILFKTPQD